MDPRVKAGIFAGESGGDYNALFGFSHRPGKQFAGTNLTGMTVDQAIAFADPRGPYAQWVKGQIGRVATPMGAYQIVGDTLKAAKDWAGLRGDELMTEEVQDKLGEVILANQGTGAWEGYKGPRNAASVSPYNLKPDDMPPRSLGGAGSPSVPSNYGGAGEPASSIGPTSAPLPPAVAAALPAVAGGTKDKDSALEAMARAAGGMGGKGGYQMQLPPQVGAARVDQPATPLIDPQQTEYRRQMLAQVLARLNQGSLV